VPALPSSRSTEAPGRRRPRPGSHRSVPRVSRPVADRPRRSRRNGAQRLRLIHGRVPSDDPLTRPSRLPRSDLCARARDSRGLSNRRSSRQTPACDRRPRQWSLADGHHHRLPDRSRSLAARLRHHTPTRHLRGEVVHPPVRPAAPRHHQALAIYDEPAPLASAARRARRRGPRPAARGPPHEHAAAAARAAPRRLGQRRAVAAAVRAPLHALGDAADLDSSHSVQFLSCRSVMRSRSTPHSPGWRSAVARGRTPFVDEQHRLSALLVVNG
jgi:hypothetical protein